MTTSLTEADRQAELHRLIASGRAQQIRAKSGLSLRMVARSIGAESSMVSRWERGKRRPHGPAAMAYLKLLLRLGKALP